MNHICISTHLRRTGYVPGEWEPVLNSSKKFRTWTKRVGDNFTFQVDEEQEQSEDGRFRSSFHFLIHESLPEEIEFGSVLWLLNVEDRFKSKFR